MASERTPSHGRLTRALWLARAVMLWERSATVWAPLLLGSGLIATAGLWGLFELGPPLAQTLIVAAVLLAALVFAVLGALRVRWPSRDEARKRVEADSRLHHEPLAALEDRPATGDTALWDLHRARSVGETRRTRVGRPAAGLARNDPFALRWALVIAALLALWVRGPGHADAALKAFRPVSQAVSVSLSQVRTWVGAKP